MINKPICLYHWQRRQIEVIATRNVQGEFMCDDCFSGKPLTPRRAAIPEYPRDIREGSESRRVRGRVYPKKKTWVI